MLSVDDRQAARATPPEAGERLRRRSQAHLVVAGPQAEAPQRVAAVHACAAVQVLRGPDDRGTVALSWITFLTALVVFALITVAFWLALMDGAAREQVALPVAEEAERQQLINKTKLLKKVPNRPKKQLKKLKKAEMLLVEWAKLPAWLVLEWVDLLRS